MKGYVSMTSEWVSHIYRLQADSGLMRFMTIVVSPSCYKKVEGKTNGLQSEITPVDGTKFYTLVL